MAFKKRTKAYLTADGTYGGGDIILFEVDDLTDKQWETLEGLPDNARIEYVSAIMAGEPLDEWENEA